MFAVVSTPPERRNLASSDLTEAVAASFAGAPDPRFRRIAESLVRHLHAFVEDVRPTEAEWFAAIDFLTRTGHTTTETRQEFVLLSDVLGVSMLVIGLALILGVGVRLASIGGVSPTQGGGGSRAVPPCSTPSSSSAASRSSSGSSSSTRTTTFTSAARAHG